MATHVVSMEGKVLGHCVRGLGDVLLREKTSSRCVLRWERGKKSSPELYTLLLMKSDLFYKYVSVFLLIVCSNQILNIKAIVGIALCHESWRTVLVAQ